MNDGLEFSQLLLRHNQMLLRYIMTFVPRRTEAEEILQRAATALWEKFDEFDRTRDFLPWAYRFTYIEVLNYRKEQARSRLIFDVDVLNELKSTREQLEPTFELQRTALRDCLKLVNPESLQLLQRRYCDSESAGQLARETGQTVKALYRRLDRVRELVARCMHQKLAHELS